MIHICNLCLSANWKQRFYNNMLTLSVFKAWRTTLQPVRCTRHQWPLRFTFALSGAFSLDDTAWGETQLHAHLHQILFSPSGPICLWVSQQALGTSAEHRGGSEENRSVSLIRHACTQSKQDRSERGKALLWVCVCFLALVFNVISFIHVGQQAQLKQLTSLIPAGREEADKHVELGYDLKAAKDSTWIKLTWTCCF